MYLREIWKLGMNLLGTVPVLNVRKRDIINRDRYGSAALLNTPNNVGF